MTAQRHDGPPTKTAARSAEGALVEFADDGHLTPEALVLLADGEATLPAAGAHLDTCESCTARLVEMSVASLEAGEALRGMVSAEARAVRPAEPEAARDVAPWWAVGLALGVSSLCLAPLAGRLPALALHAVPALAHAGPVLTRGLAHALVVRGQGAFLASLVSSALLVLAGLVVSRSYRSSGVSS
jgi:hypothetical protein